MEPGYLDRVEPILCCDWLVISGMISPLHPLSMISRDVFAINLVIGEVWPSWCS